MAGMAERAKKRRGPGRKGYSPEKKAEVLAAAKKEGLTGAQVAKRFGISTLTFYKWRGPVRRKARTAKRGPGRPRGNGRERVDTAIVRQAVRTQKMLPQIIREEVARALEG